MVARGFQQLYESRVNNGLPCPVAVNVNHAYPLYRWFEETLFVLDVAFFGYTPSRITA